MIKPRRVLACAITTTRLPALMSGTMSDSQYPITCRAPPQPQQQQQQQGAGSISSSRTREHVAAAAAAAETKKYVRIHVKQAKTRAVKGLGPSFPH